jgi:hypothetical protein
MPQGCPCGRLLLPWALWREDSAHLRRHPRRPAVWSTAAPSNGALACAPHRICSAGAVSAARRPFMTSDCLAALHGLSRHSTLNSRTARSWRDDCAIPFIAGSPDSNSLGLLWRRRQHQAIRAQRSRSVSSSPGGMTRANARPHSAQIRRSARDGFTARPLRPSTSAGYPSR